MKVPLLTGIFSRLRSKKTSGVPSALNAPEVSGPSSWSDDLDLTLTTLLSDKESKSYGTVQTITLSEFRDSLGPLWEQYSDKIEVIADTTIDRMIGKSHTAIREDEDTWLLVTPDLTHCEAELFAKSIATAIGEKLVGARFEETSQADPTPQTGLVDLSDAMNKDGSINKDAIKNAVAAAKAAMAAQAGNRKRERARQDKARELRHHMRTDRTHGKTDAEPKTVQAEAGLTISYCPAWSSDTQSIDTFYCRPIGTDSTNPFHRPDPIVVAANAIAVTRTCITTLQTLIDSEVKSKLVVPVPLQVILSPAQRQILKAFSKLHESHRFLYLRPEIVEVPHSASASELLTARDLLSTVGRDVSISMDLFDLNRAVVSVDKIRLGCDARNDDAGQIQKTAGALGRVQSLAGKRKTYALGLRAKDSLKIAIELGFAEVGGPGLVEPLTDKPSSTTPYLRETLLQNLTLPS